jgi:hypothetical protein
MTKTLNQIINFFLHQNQNIFFSNIANQNIFLEKNHNPPSPFKLNGRSLIILLMDVRNIISFANIKKTNYLTRYDEIWNCYFLLNYITRFPENQSESESKIVRLIENRFVGSSVWFKTPTNWFIYRLWSIIGTPLLFRLVYQNVLTQTVNDACILISLMKIYW